MGSDNFFTNTTQFQPLLKILRFAFCGKTHKYTGLPFSRCQISACFSQLQVNLLSHRRKLSTQHICFRRDRDVPLGIDVLAHKWPQVLFQEVTPCLFHTNRSEGEDFSVKTDSPNVGKEPFGNGDCSAALKSVVALSAAPRPGSPRGDISLFHPPPERPAL